MTSMAVNIKDGHYRSRDPDPDALLLVVTSVLIPIVSVLYQVAVEQHRSRIEDSRATRKNIQKIENALALTSSTLTEIEQIIRLEGLKNVSRWAPGHRGVELEPAYLQKYFRMVEDTAQALKIVEDAAVELSVFFKPSRRTAPWLDDLRRLHLLTSRIHLLDTYGEVVRNLRWAVRIAQDVLEEIQSELEA